MVLSVIVGSWNEHLNDGFPSPSPGPFRARMRNPEKNGLVQETSGLCAEGVLWNTYTVCRRNIVTHSYFLHN